MGYGDTQYGAEYSSDGYGYSTYGTTGYGSPIYKVGTGTDSSKYGGLALGDGAYGFADVDYGKIVSASASVLSSDETATASETGSVTSSEATPIQWQESAAVSDDGSVTAAEADAIPSDDDRVPAYPEAQATPVRSLETTQPNNYDPGSVTAADASPVVPDSSASADTTPDPTQATASTLATTEKTGSKDVGSITGASASAVDSDERTGQVDPGSITSATAETLSPPPADVPHEFPLNGVAQTETSTLQGKAGWDEELHASAGTTADTVYARYSDRVRTLVALFQKESVEVTTSSDK